MSSVQFYSIYKTSDKKQEIEKINIMACLNCNENSNEDIIDEVILFTKDSALVLHFIDLLKYFRFIVNQRLPSLSVKIDSPPPNFKLYFFFI